MNIDSWEYEFQVDNRSRNETLTIVSGEYPQLNGKQLRGGTLLSLKLVVPAGYRLYERYYRATNNRASLYLGYIVEDF